MKWITRARPKTDRIACPWLIRRFIDPDAEFLFVPADQVMDVAAAEGGHAFDTTGATYTHRKTGERERCTFEVLIDEYHLGDNPALARLAQIVHAADVSDDRGSSPEGPGLYAIAHGFAILHGTEDHRKIELESPMYDALYAWCQDQTSTA